MKRSGLAMILSFLLSTLMLPSFAAAICEHGHPAYAQQEYFHWVESGPWELYAWTRKPFDPTLPTVLFFNGGPGQSSHGSEWDIPGWNLIFWDQRGVGCSKPKNELQYLDNGSYSIEGTAEDAKAILKYFGVSKASLYGVSYGTAPATVLASKHPQLVRAVVLEGTLYSGAESLHNSPFRQNILKSYFRNLDPELKDTIQIWSYDSELHTAWFSRLGFYFMGFNDGLKKFTDFLKAIKESDSFSPGFFNNFGPRAFEDEELGFSARTYAAIACQELSQGSDKTFGGLQIKNKTLHKVEDLPAKSLCRGIAARKNFEARHFPIDVPVTYFQGAHDGATSADQAILHFKHVAKGAKVLNLLKEGGHTPLSGDLFDPFSGDESLKQTYMRMLTSALLGEPSAWSVEHKNWIQVRRN